LATGARKWVVALAGAVLFIVGAGVGALLLNQWFSPAAPPADTPVPQLLAEAHRLLDGSDLVEAEKKYISILKQDPANPEAITHLGNIASRRGDLAVALRNYDEALRSDPSYIHALWDKALALRDKGDDVGAIQAWEAFARLVPADSQDAATAKKWIAESQERLTTPLGSTRKVKALP
jgi:cytochrome c-type biogenesis protein CcmH/NrfG